MENTMHIVISEPIARRVAVVAFAMASRSHFKSTGIMTLKTAQSRANRVEVKNLTLYRDAACLK